MPWNVGIIGFGHVAKAHVKALNGLKNVQVTAVCSSRALPAEQLPQHNGQPVKLYRDLNNLLADPDIDVVSICSYHHYHARQAIMAANAGKHVIIEKPVALNLSDFERVLHAVKTSGIKACVCFECRFAEQFLRTKALIDDQVLGQVHYGEVDYYHGIGPWIGQFRWNIKKDMGGSSLLTAGCHALDALLLCMGEDVVEVSSYATSTSNQDFAPYEYATSQITLLKFADGRIGKCASIIDSIQPYYFHVHLVGSEGSLLDNKLYSKKKHSEQRQWEPLEMKMVDSGHVGDHPYLQQFQAFFDALSQDQTMPLTSLDHARRTHEVIFAADQSAHENRPVQLI